VHTATNKNDRHKSDLSPEDMRGTDAEVHPDLGPLAEILVYPKAMNPKPHISRRLRNKVLKKWLHS